MKQILLYGATGKTGEWVLQYALEKGIEVNALVRNPSKLHNDSELLHIFEGTPYNIENVRTAIEGCDAVISTLGNSRTSAKPFQDSRGPVDLMSKSIQNTIKVMDEIGLKRIAIVSFVGAGDSLKFTPTLMKWIFTRSFFKIIREDHTNQEKSLEQSDLDWTIVRPVALSNSDQLADLHIQDNENLLSFRVSRKAVGKFLVDCLDNEEFYHKHLMLCEK